MENQSSAARVRPDPPHRKSAMAPNVCITKDYHLVRQQAEEGRGLDAMIVEASERARTARKRKGVLCATCGSPVGDIEPIVLTVEGQALCAKCAEQYIP